MVSTTNGILPQWSADGKRLFYVALNGAFLTVDVQAGTVFQAGTPRRLLGNAIGTGGYGVTRASDRFLFAQFPNTGPPPPFTLLLNWTSRLTR